MNVIEREIIDVLKSLKEEHGVFEIKAEFEAEGSRMEEIMRLKDVTSQLDLPLILKIGGCEGITDIFNGLLIGVHGIIAPMTETAFAVSKFIKSIETFIPDDNKEDLDFAVNIETITACNNIDSILALENIDALDSITIGRSDLVGSMGYAKNMVDSDEILTLVTSVLKKAKEKSLKTAVGGTITPSSIGFIKELYTANLIDKYETRKVVFSSSSIESNPEIGLDKAFKFEYLWLKSKQRYYSRIKVEDQHRIDLLEKRIEI